MFVVGKNLEVQLTFGGHDIVFILQQPTTEQLTKYISDRYPIVGKSVENDSVAASVILMDALLVDVKNMGYLDKGKDKVLDNKVENWKDKIPVGMKRTLAMMFDETRAEVIEGAKPTSG